MYQRASVSPGGRGAWANAPAIQVFDTADPQKTQVTGADSQRGGLQGATGCKVQYRPRSKRPYGTIVTDSVYSPPAGRCGSKVW